MRSLSTPDTQDHEQLARACAELEAPFAVIDMDAFTANTRELARRAAGKRIRLASKSLRCRELIMRLLADPAGAFSGVLVLTVAEALWLSDHGVTDVVVGYPSVDRSALDAVASRASSGTPGTGITVMVDAVEHLDLLGSLGGRFRVSIEADAGLWLLGGRLRIGPRRSPLHTPAQVGAFAKQIARRPGLELVGMMAYEGQIAGVGDSPAGRPLRAGAIRAMQGLSRRELRARRRELVAAVEAVAGPLAFVNAGGTGSLESSAAEPWVSELTAGSGLFGPALFDDYTRFRPRPAAFYVLPVVRRPGRGVVTALGGGYVASGPAGADRLPRPWWPAGLSLDRNEGAGETQTPLRGGAADQLAIGDRVWMRHAKAGELCERFTRLYLVSGERIVDEVATYRGEGRCFL
ncbi:amino acid deaminase/aldolase [Conexibacter sp. S30A1]|uniref:amino acid deaminase/aldolase n=1 Tax=Conexibacter sp. S30A1 TaxID=2937800 RepID=UPI00200EE331|nr:amino acid deaminase/aldolase [Conexibacter sp. S30A1]